MGPLDLFVVAAKRAIEDAGISKDEIDGIITRGPDDINVHHQRVGQLLGLNVNFSTSTDNGGASQILNVAMACMAIDAGMCTTVLCGYGRDAWSRTHRNETARMRVATTDSSLARQEFGPEFGLFGAPANYALAARRHMQLFGTTKEQLGAIAIAFREHAARNPEAFVRDPLTMEDYLSARPIVDPLSFFDYSIFADAAGAVIVTSLERARSLRRPPARVPGLDSGTTYGGGTTARTWSTPALSEPARPPIEWRG